MMKFFCPCKRESPPKIIEGLPFPTTTETHRKGPKVTNLRGEEVFALYDYSPHLSSELAFLRNDVLTIIGQFDQPWQTAINMRTGQKGLIPHNYVTYDTAIAGALSAWYPVNRIEAEKKLLIPGTATGTFLIRPSREPMAYALSCRTLCGSVVKIRHFQIYRTNDRTGFYINEESPFTNMNDLLDFYMTNGMVYLESIQFVHRDLRAANVFVAKDGRVKVGDFGQSKMLSMPSSNPTSNLSLTSSLKKYEYDV
ncbi:unnamed protein product [Taenia asiatica]|uniref:Tyrosine-protein kinase n=1 Tax=Taenia asiatica TaxID=60517 RepID=A0A0R3VXW9_TAEAS|nr:unnamed protein product [Taenia asiatica]